MKKPNIVYFFVDDMGYGDVSCLNPRGKISTARIDFFAEQGMIFTDAHSTSAVCSPSRYSVLTGRYNWRSTLQKGIVPVYGDPLIDKDCLTVPKLLRKNGYHTACIGKWHLGMGWDFEITEDFLPEHGYDSTPDSWDAEPTDEQRALWKEAFSRPVFGGPKAAGFDYSFGVDIPNWPPYCFIENGKTVGEPSEWLHPRLLGNNLASLQGPAMPYWHFEQLLPTFAVKADRYIRERAEKEEPFFLYFASTSPHTPLSVNKPWIGKSGLDNLYADFVLETDDLFGRVLDSLKRHGVEDNTLVIFASDNGCANYIGVDQLEARGHYPSAQYRGYKADIWDGGHRIPCIARWPGVIRAGSTSDALVSLSDLMATCADFLHSPLPDNAGEDSVSMMPLFTEEKDSVRDHVVHHSFDGKFAIRDARWKLVLCPGSGSWNRKDHQAAKEGLPLLQLYDMESDPGETVNLYREFPEKVKSLLWLLEKIVKDGRSTPGLTQLNDVFVDVWKLDTIPDVDVSVLSDY